MWKYIPDLSGEFILFFAFPLAGLIIGIIIWYRFQKALSQNKLQGAT
jgi:cytochrome c-type biogenesis protein CcmH/NrfF